MSWTRAALVALALTTATSAAAETRRICAYDPAGKAGDFYAIMQDFAVEASGWGVQIELEAYTDEETAAKDYEAGHCDGVVATGVRLQRFNRFPSTLEGMGALKSYELQADMVRTLAKYPSAAAKLKAGEHETVGFMAAGTVWLFLRDRSVDTVPELAGKRVATMDYDKAVPVMVERVGAIMVPADLGSIGPKFNNGAVDLSYMSAPGYHPFEMWRGMEPKGGVLRYPLGQATLQLMVRHHRFPSDFGSKSREVFASELYPRSVKNAEKADAEIPARYWVEVPSDQMAQWDEMFLDVRVKLRDEGVYDGAMLAAMRKLRCAREPGRAECAQKRE